MQAVLIQAHKNIDQVIELSSLLRKKFEVYVHVDTKTQVTNIQRQKLDKLGVICIFKVNVHWSGWSVAQASIELLKEALKNPSIEYVHIISGQDWPLKDIEDIYNFYEGKNYSYVENVLAKDIRKTGEPVIWWEKYYFNYDKINRKTIFGKVYHRLSLLIQTLLRVNKFKKYNINLNMYTGSQWVDLPRKSVEFILEYLENHQNLLHVFKTGFCSDEFWIPTILLNSKEFRSSVINNNHRFILEEKKNGSLPAILDSRDFEAIHSSNYHFGRKFESPYSDKLIEKLNIK